MKSFILILLAIAGLFGAVLIMNYSKENSTENNTQNIVEDSNVKNDEDQKEESEDNHEDDEEHDHSVEIEGSEMKNLTVQEVADLWEIDAEILLSEIIAEFELKGDYTTATVLEEIRDAEYKFSPAIIKDIAEEIKQGQ